MNSEGAESLAICGSFEIIGRFHPTFLIETHGEVAGEGLHALHKWGHQLVRLDAQGRHQPGGPSGPIGLERRLAPHPG